MSTLITCRPSSTHACIWKASGHGATIKVLFGLLLSIDFGSVVYKIKRSCYRGVSRVSQLSHFAQGARIWGAPKDGKSEEFFWCDTV